MRCRRPFRRVARPRRASARSLRSASLMAAIVTPGKGPPGSRAQGGSSIAGSSPRSREPLLRRERPAPRFGRGQSVHEEGEALSRRRGGRRRFASAARVQGRAPDRCPGGVPAPLARSARSARSRADRSAPPPIGAAREAPRRGAIRFRGPGRTGSRRATLAAWRGPGRGAGPRVPGESAQGGQLREGRIGRIGGWQRRGVRLDGGISRNEAALGPAPACCLRRRRSRRRTATSGGRTGRWRDSCVVAARPAPRRRDGAGWTVVRRRGPGGRRRSRWARTGTPLPPWVPACQLHRLLRRPESAVAVHAQVQDPERWTEELLELGRIGGLVGDAPAHRVGIPDRWMNRVPGPGRRRSRSRSGARKPSALVERMKLSRSPPRLRSAIRRWAVLSATRSTRHRRE